MSLVGPEVKTYWFAKTVLNEKSNNVTNVTNLKIGTFDSKFSEQVTIILKRKMYNIM